MVSLQLCMLLVAILLLLLFVWWCVYDTGILVNRFPFSKAYIILVQSVWRIFVANRLCLAWARKSLVSSHLYRSHLSILENALKFLPRFFANWILSSIRRFRVDKKHLYKQKFSLFDYHCFKARLLILSNSHSP